MASQADVVAGLTKAYWMEIETVQNYIANSVNLDGVRAEQVKTALGADVAVQVDGHSRPHRDGAALPSNSRYSPRVDRSTA